MSQLRLRGMHPTVEYGFEYCVRGSENRLQASRHSTEEYSFGYCVRGWERIGYRLASTQL